MEVFNTQATRLVEMFDKKANKGFVDVTSDITVNVVGTTFRKYEILD